MGSTTLDAIETAQRVLVALAGKRRPDRADIDKLRRLAPPFAKMPPDELAAAVLRLARTISAIPAVMQALPSSSPRSPLNGRFEAQHDGHSPR